MTKDIEEIRVFVENGGDLNDLSIEKLENLKKYRLIKQINLNPEKEPVCKIPSIGESKSGNDDHMTIFVNRYWKKYDSITTASGYENKPEESKKDAIFQVYANSQWKEWGIEGLWANTDSDTGCADEIGDWSPADTYAKIVWDTFVCKADLFKIAVKGISINAGDGLGVQIRIAGPISAPQVKNSCECGSCASITFATYPVTLLQYNLEAIVCGLDAFDVGDALMDSYLIAMSNSWAKFFDQEIYDALEEATPGTSTQLPVDLNCDASIAGSCCTDSSLLNLWNAVNKTVASMREGSGLVGPYDPDYLLISPSVAEIFKRMQTPTSQFASASVQFDSEGRLKKLGSLKVIEYCGANSCTDLADEVVAIVIDSRRAVAAAFGMRPKLYKFFQSNCNSTRLDFWSYFGVAACDTDAIGHIINAN